MIHSGLTRARCQHKQNFEQNWKTFTSQRGQIVFPPRSHKYNLGFFICFCGGLLYSCPHKNAFFGPLQPFFSYLMYPVLSPNSRFPGNFCLSLFSKSFTERQCLINEESSCVDSLQRKISPEQIATTENDIACRGGMD